MKRFLLILALWFAWPAAGAPEARPAFDQENCSLCHIRESVFFDPSFLSPESSRSFDEERLCDSCHNGAVQDSRGRLWRGAQHPALPRERGKGRRCTPCHTPHGKGGWSVLAGTEISLHKGGNAVCAGCHPARGKGLHAGKSAEGVGCRDCHAAHGGVGSALLRDAGAAVCRKCHGSLESDKAGGHPLSVSSPQKSAAALPGCLSCHPAHSPAGPPGGSFASCPSCHDFRGKGAVKGGKSHPEHEECGTCHTFHSRRGEGGRAFRGKEIRFDVLCRNCHGGYWAADPASGRAAGTHVATGRKGEICGVCHKIHNAPPGTPLLRSGKPYFCLECHERQNTIRETGGISLAHPVFEKIARDRLSAVVREKKLPMGPAGEIVCGTCHKVHGAGKGTALLAPGAEKAESCFWCHPGKRGKSHAGEVPGQTVSCASCHPVHGRPMSGADPWRSVCGACHREGSRHPEAVGDRSIGRTKDLPEFDARGRRAPYGAVSCPPCHEPHGETSNPKRLRKPFRPNGFLCTACHRTMESVVLTPHDLRGIASEGICEPCHKPHGGQGPWMWGLSSGTGWIGEDACRSCHGTEGGKGLGTRIPQGGHSLNVIASRPVPDHFPRIGPNGEISRTGVVSCPTCHAVHGSGVVPEGKGVGKLLRGPRGEETSLRPPHRICAECHAGSELRHGTADCLSCHPPHSEGKGQLLCTPCHTATSGRLYGRHRDAGKECRSCHRMHPRPAPDNAIGDGCVDCHPSAGRIRGTPHGKNGPNGCTPCHPVHREPAADPLRPKLGERLHLPDVPCLRCHRDGGEGPVPEWGMHPSKIREIPTNYGAVVVEEIPVTMVGRFKEGDRPMFPLFDDQGRVSFSGTMGCLTCHDPHAGGVKDGAPAANAYLRDPNFAFLSEMCGACHRDENSDRVRNFHRRKR